MALGSTQSPSAVVPMVGPSTRNSRKTTASKPLLSTSKSIEDHAIGMGIRTDVNSSITARKLLATHGLSLPVAGKAIKDIATALFELSIATNIGATNTEILRAVAFILYEADQASDMERVVDKIDSLLKGPIATLEINVDTLSELTSTHKTTLAEAVTEVREQLNQSSEGIEKMVEAASTRASQQSLHREEPPRSNGSMTYAAATKAGMPVQLNKILARNEAQSRQILIDRRSLFSDNSLKQLTEVQLVSKATMALELLAQNKIEYPQDLMFISARRLPHGGVLYELDSSASAEWFNTPANRSNFLEFFGTNVVIKERSFHVLMENVPISFVPDNTAALADIEKKAGLKPRTVSKAKYIKPIARRNPNQRTAHVVVTISTKEGANHAIKFGLSIAGKKVYGRKLLPEPTRCLKCHSFDGSHIAADCPQDHDTCGTCGEHHRTHTCTVEDPSLYACVNCKENGHASWSRECPTFVQKWNTQKGRNNETKYTFFPTDDPLTWETIPNADTNWSDVPEPVLNERPHPTLQGDRHPPPQRNNWEWQEVGNSNRNRRMAFENNPRNPNNVPLGPKGQTRLPDAWSSQPQNTQPTQAPQPNSQSSPRSWSPTPPPQDLSYSGSTNDTPGWN